MSLDAARLVRARERIRDYLDAHGVPEEVGEDVVLAIEEAMTNAVLHSGASGDLEVRLVFRESDLSVEVRDRGRGFDVSSFDRERVPDMLQPGGRGLYLISQMMDELELVASGGTSVRMVKHGALGAHDGPQPTAPS